ncbi:MAG: hypothetical protein CMO69_00100 [Verrucomicrobiales bacterium]|nr:hypothetical protein [Verrucomicrobiales bacterium]
MMSILYRVINSQKVIFLKVCFVMLLIIDASSIPPANELDVSNKSQWIEGATLKTDSTVDELISRAKQFSNEGRYDLASSLWQKVIDSSNDLVFGSEEWLEKTLSHEYQVYRSVSREIENTLAQLPKEGLEGYRVDADGQAKIILSSYKEENERENALSELVKKYFLSSLGDDAAYELACLKLDRYEFLPAIRLIDKILDDYPDTDINLSHLLIRAAVLSARVGDLERAKNLLIKLKSEKDSIIPKSVIEIVENDILRSDKIGVVSQRSTEPWSMNMGGAKRSGLMQTPLNQPLDKGEASWVQQYDLTLPEGWPKLPLVEDNKPDINLTAPFGNAIGGGSRLYESANKKLTNDQILLAWKEEDWMPCGQLLFGSQFLYFKNEDRLVCADADTGAVKWLGFRTQYPQPNFSKNFRFRRPTSKDTKRIPRDVKEIQYFSDHANQSMCLVAGKIITVQGAPVDFTEEESPIEPNVDNDLQRGVWQNRIAGGRGVPRMRKNRLVAYHALNGKLQWMRSATEKKEDLITDSCFIGDPVPYGNLLLIPVLEGTGMYLTALNPESGDTQWRTFLGDEPQSGVAPNSSVMVAIDGGEAYIATGSGLVFSLDAISGSLNWVVRYPRTVRNNASRLQELQRFGGFARGNVAAPDFDGWDMDTVVPSTKVVVFAPSDFNQLIALDRRSGKLIWETARVPLREGNGGSYVLGLLDEKLYIGGGDVVRCYDVIGGKMLWENSFPRGHGRGALTKDGILIPSGNNEIIKISLNNGSIEDQITVALENNYPIGNLFSNGKNIYIMSLRQVLSVIDVSKAKDERGKQDQLEGNEGG